MPTSQLSARVPSHADATPLSSQRCIQSLKLLRAGAANQPFAVRLNTYKHSLKRRIHEGIL